MKTVQRILSDLWSFTKLAGSLVIFFAILTLIGFRLRGSPPALGIYIAITVFIIVWICSKFVGVKANKYVIVQTIPIRSNQGKFSSIIASVNERYCNDPADAPKNDISYPNFYMIPLVDVVEGTEKVRKWGRPGYEQNKYEDGKILELDRTLSVPTSFIRKKIGLEFIGLFNELRPIDFVETKYVPAHSVMAKITGNTREAATRWEQDAERMREQGMYEKWVKDNPPIIPDRDDYDEDSSHGCWSLRWFSHNWKNTDELRQSESGQMWAIIVREAKATWVPAFMYAEVVITGAETGKASDAENPEMIPVSIPMQCMLEIVDPHLTLSRMTTVLAQFEAEIAGKMRDYVAQNGGIDKLERAHFSEVGGSFEKFILSLNGHWVKSVPGDPNDQNYHLTDGLISRYGFALKKAIVREWHPSTRKAEEALNSRIKLFVGKQEAKLQETIGDGLGKRYAKELEGRADGQVNFYKKVGPAAKQYRRELNEGGVLPEVKAQSEAIGKLHFLSIGGKNPVSPFFDINKAMEATGLPDISMKAAEIESQKATHEEHSGDGHGHADKTHDDHEGGHDEDKEKDDEDKNSTHH